ncbi:uncharacterized protein BO66DRAFT_36025 [Aspergillus aculeatinus CBS 121060]|uniref:Uncharacterized protein n=1 Tax=Aspergillus aculeatinus CBS 121060 TaxID=1448322 RepID=A0ACD1HGB2_9EURO|nr:hypothetical protein BO66DRAFT_36025 [Aspergillus aculeatinus CBS 121060]RAH72444.1 hypothetical protein BO66DRAFT_36025 [Aspergillus aculeatinus CBS 121060]
MDTLRAVLTYSQEWFLAPRCCVCLRRFHSAKPTIRLECDHLYCVKCLKGSFFRATQEPSLFPPTCCKTVIPLRLAKEYMTEKELYEYDKAKLEFLTTNWTRCSKKTCRVPIPPNRVTAYQARCLCCGTSTCVWCKAASPLKNECDKKPALSQPPSSKNNLGWQQCFDCKALVERTSGCSPTITRFCNDCGRRRLMCRCGMEQAKDLYQARQLSKEEYTQRW